MGRPPEGGTPHEVASAPHRPTATRPIRVARGEPARQVRESGTRHDSIERTRLSRPSVVEEPRALSRAASHDAAPWCEQAVDWELSGGRKLIADNAFGNSWSECAHPFLRFPETFVRKRDVKDVRGSGKTPTRRRLGMTLLPRHTPCEKGHRRRVPRRRAHPSEIEISDRAVA